MQSPRAVEHFVVPERLEKLIASVAADQDEAWRRTVLAQLLFSAKMVERLAEMGRLGVLVKIVERESSADVRRQMLSMLFQNTAAITALIENDQLEFVLRLIAKEPDKRVRGDWINRMLAGSGAVKRLVEDGQLDKLLKFAIENVDDAQRSEMLRRMFQNTLVVRAILEKSGVDRLIALTAAERAPAARGRLLATLLSSSAVQQHLTEPVRYELTLKLAREEKSATARNEYLKTVFSTGAAVILFRDVAGRKTVWELVKKDTGKESQQWRSEALFRLFIMSSGEQLLNDASEAAWLMRFLREDVSPEHLSRILQRLVGDYRLRQVLLTQGHFDRLLLLIKDVEAAQRGRLMAQLFSTSDPSQKIANTKRIELMVKLAKEESDQDARHQYLQGLFLNRAAMTALMERGFYDDLWSFVSIEKDPVRHATLRAEFIRTNAVIQTIAKRKQLDTLVEFAQDHGDPEARREYLRRLFSNVEAISMLIDQGHYEALFSLAGSDNDDATGVMLLGEFYSNAKVVERLIEKGQAAVLLEFAKQHSDDKRLRNFLQRLFYNRQALAALIEQEHLLTLFSLARQQEDKHIRASLMRAVLGLPQVVQYYAGRDQLKQLFELMKEESPEARQQVYYNLTGRSETVAMLVKNGQLDAVLAQLKQESQPEMRGQFLARFVVHHKAFDHLVAKNRVDLILELAREQEDEGTRRGFLQGLFSSSTAVGALLERGHFEALYKLASSDSDPGRRAGHLAQLLANSKTVEHLVAGKKTGLLLSVASGQSDQQVRRNVLSRILYSHTAVAAIVEHGEFNQLVKLCRSDSDPTARRRMLAALLQSEKAVEQLAETEALERTVREVLDEPDRNARRQFLEGWLVRSNVVDAMLDEGLFDMLYKTAEAEGEAARRRRMLGYLLTRPNAIQRLAASGKIDFVMRIISEETDASRAGIHLRNVLSKPDTLKAVLAGAGFDRLLRLVEQQKSASPYSSPLTSFLFNLATYEHLAANNQAERLGEAILRVDNPKQRQQFIQRLIQYSSGRELLGRAKLGDVLVAMLKAETEDKYRRSAAHKILRYESYWSVLINSGQADAVFEIAKWEPDEEQRRSSIRRITYDPSGLLSYHLRRGELEEAERLLEENAGDDLGRLRLATCLLATGRIDERIAEVRKSLEQPSSEAASGPPATADEEAQASGASPRTNDARLLTYLLRANGDLEGACDAARLAEDPGLLRAVLVDARRWSEAAQLVATSPCPLPIPTRYRPAQDPKHQRAEQLGLLATYQRLAGQEADCEKTVAEIHHLATSHSGDAALRWFCVEALLLNDRVDAGLKLLAETYPWRAFDLYTHRHQYREALELAGWRDGTLLDRAWLDSLATDGGSTTQQAVSRTEFGLKVARTLRQLGKPEEAEQIIKLLDGYVGEQPDGRSTSATRNQCSQRMCVALAKMGCEERAWQAGARTLLNPTSMPPMLSRLYPKNYREALGWWMFSRNCRQSEPPTESFARVHRILNPPPEENAEQFASLVEEAVKEAESFTDSRRDHIMAAVGESCRSRDQLGLARRCLETAVESCPTARSVLAEVYRDSERWLDAAETYEAVWENDRDQLAALYLAGDAFQRAGRSDDGRRCKELAMLTALDSRSRLDMALSLIRHGLREQGIQQLKLVLRTAPLEHWEWQEAARQLNDHVLDENPAQAADLLQFSLLDDLRTYFFLLDDKDYLFTPSMIHQQRARAAIREGNFEEADREIRLALAASPGNSRVAIDLVPFFEQAGREEQAADLFGKLHQAYSEWTEEYPACALLHNDLAWLCARCGRRLDEALEHAKQAVELDPNNASHLDTLAECHFRLGDRNTAIGYSQRAVQLRPRSTSLKQQLDRFQSDPLPARSK